MSPILPNAEEAEAIRSGNRDLINKYYLANYELLRRYISIYCRNNIYHLDYCTHEDLINQIYIEFDKIQFDCNAYFFCSVRHILHLYLVGGKRKYAQLTDINSCGSELYILDKPLGDSKESATVGDMMSYDLPLEKIVINGKLRSERVFEKLCDFLTEPQRSVFEFWFFSNMSAREIGLALGRSQQAVEQSKRKMLIKFRKYQDDVLDCYDKAGCDIPEEILKKAI